jgi:hypothetical protein
VPEYFAEVLERHGCWSPALEVAYVRSLQERIKPRGQLLRRSPEPARVFALLSAEPARWWTVAEVLELSVLPLNGVKRMVACMVDDGRLEKRCGPRVGGQGPRRWYRVLR